LLAYANVRRYTDASPRRDKGHRLKLHPELVEATFIRRLNRFVALLTCRGEEVMAHVANSGQLGELLFPGNRMLLTPVDPGSGRKTAFDLTLVEVDGVLVSADARLPNALLQEAIENGDLPEFASYETLKREVRFHDSRLDLMLTGAAGTCFIEAKSVTLVEEGVGLFPDAPTERGRKHLGTLSAAVACGHEAAVAFVVQRPDVKLVTPNQRTDPEFCRALADAANAGVKVHAYRCAVSETSIRIDGSVPVQIPDLSSGAV